MSVQSQMTRISNNVTNTLNTISEMGGTVPANATSDDMATAAATIPVARIDDASVSTTTTYSSSKIESRFAEIGTQEEIVQQVIAALGTPVFGTIDEENNIILTGELADGTYTVKYEDAEGNVTEIGTIVQGGSTTTNLFDPDTATLNTRMSGSSSTSKAANGYVMTSTITIPETSITGATAGDAYIAVPASMWANSANLFLLKNDAVYTIQGYMDCGNSPGTVSGDWVTIPLRDQWGTTFTAAGVIVSLYVSASAITADDIANIQIYFNECPE